MAVMKKSVQVFMRKNRSKFPVSGFVFFVFTVMAAIMATGCGYRPVSGYARQTLPGPVYVDVHLSGVEPQNGVYLKDEILRVLMTRFHQKTVSRKELSVSQIIVPRYTIGYSALTYDTNGYVTRYRVSVNIDFEMFTSRGKISKTISSSEDVSIQPSSLTSSAARETAIRAAIRKAMDQFIAYVGYKGYLQ